MLISNAILMQQGHEKSSFYCIKGQRRRSSITLPESWGTREAKKQIVQTEAAEAEI